jgi:hypothetical protein
MKRALALIAAAGWLLAAGGGPGRIFTCVPMAVWSGQTLHISFFNRGAQAATVEATFHDSLNGNLLGAGKPSVVPSRHGLIIEWHNTGPQPLNVFASLHAVDRNMDGFASVSLLGSAGAIAVGLMEEEGIAAR